MIFLGMMSNISSLFLFESHKIKCDIMKRIKLCDYNPLMGPLIDVQHPLDYKKNPTPNSINIYADKLLMTYKTCLDYSKNYYIVCNKGHLSQKVVAMLEYLGYNVTQVIR